MNSAKSDILGRIRRANQGQSTQRGADYSAIQRSYRQRTGDETFSVIEKFIERLHDYGSYVVRCREHEIPGTVGALLQERAKRRLLVGRGIDSKWLPDDIDQLIDDGLSYEQIDRCDGVLTGCAAAIAVTGTIVLHHSPDQGRRAITLIPDYHLCIVLEEQIVATVPEGIRMIGNLGPGAITTISGPSATSDIEMTRVKGVHGPRMLDVIVSAMDERR